MNEQRSRVERIVDWSLGIKPGSDARQASHLSDILRNEAASIQLHKVLLDRYDKNDPQEIKVGKKRYTVGVISINPAPEISGGAGAGGVK